MKAAIACHLAHAELPIHQEYAHGHAVVDLGYEARDWSPKFETRLNIIIGIDDDVGDHFGKRTAWSLLYCLNYAYTVR